MCPVRKRQAGKAGQLLTEINVQRSQVRAKGSEDAGQHWPQMWEEGEHHKAQNIESITCASALEGEEGILWKLLLQSIDGKVGEGTVFFVTFFLTTTVH